MGKLKDGTEYAGLAGGGEEGGVEPEERAERKIHNRGGKPSMSKPLSKMDEGERNEFYERDMRMRDAKQEVTEGQRRARSGKALGREDFVQEGKAMRREARKVQRRDGRFYARGRR